jgi:hypothetical protein
MEHPGFPFDVKLGSNGQFEFASIEDVARWLATEQNAWAWTRNCGHPQITQHYQQAWQNTDQRIKNYRQFQERDKSRALPEAQQLAQQVRSDYKAGRYFTAATPEAKFLQSLSGRDVQVGALAVLLKGDPPTSGKHIEGVVRAHLYLLGVHATAEAGRSALEALQKELLDELAQARTEREKAGNESGELLSQLEAAWQTAQAAGEKQFADVRDGFEQDRERATQAASLAAKEAKERLESIESIEKTYREFMSLEAPVKYWEEQRTRYRGRSIAWGLAALVAFAAGGGLLYRLAGTWSDIVANAETHVPNAEYFLIGRAILLATIFVWVVRVLVRGFLSALHMETDAGERVVMAKTYLALFSEDKIGESDRALVLAPLFKPSSTGIVKDDAAPASWYEFLTRPGGISGRQ